MSFDSASLFDREDFKQMPRFYIQFQNNSPVHLFTQNLPIPQGESPVVADLVTAYKAAVTPRFDSTPTDELSLHLPAGADKSALDEKCFNTSVEDDDTSLDPGCHLSSLGSFGSNSKQPLIILSNLAQDTGTSEDQVVIRSLKDSDVSKFFYLVLLLTSSGLEFWLHWFFDQVFFIGFLVAIWYAFAGNNIAAIGGPIISIFTFIFASWKGMYNEVTEGWYYISEKAWKNRPNWIRSYSLIN